MENIDSSITKIYEKQQTMSGTEEEALEYLQVLERHKDLNVIIEEETDTPIKISSKSWDKIIQLVPEEKKYSLAFMCFSLINEIEENEIWGIRKNAETGEEVILQDVFFNTLLEASTPHDVPFVMCEDDFSQFTDYFNQREKEAQNRKLKISEDLAIAQPVIDKEKEKQEEKKDEQKEEDKGYEVKTEVIEDKNGVTKMVTTKVTTSHSTVYEPKIITEPKTDIKEIEKRIEKDIQKEEIAKKLKSAEITTPIKPVEIKTPIITFVFSICLFIFGFLISFLFILIILFSLIFLFTTLGISFFSFIEVILLFSICFLLLLFILFISF